MAVTIDISNELNPLISRIDKTEDFIKKISDELKTLKEDRYLSPKDAAEFLGFSYSWIMDHKLKIGCVQIGDDIRFRKSALEKYAADHYMVALKRLKRA